MFIIPSNFPIIRETYEIHENLKPTKINNHDTASSLIALNTFVKHTLSILTGLAFVVVPWLASEL